MYLIDTNVVSEARKGSRADGGVTSFFRFVLAENFPTYLSSVSVGELRRGVELVRHRRDDDQAIRLEAWLNTILYQFDRRILAFDAESAHVWGRLMVPRAEHELDRQIAAIALVYDLTVVTRNAADFLSTGVRLLNPFSTT